jgi:hypothetical protein
VDEGEVEAIYWLAYTLQRILIAHHCILNMLNKCNGEKLH